MRNAAASCDSTQLESLDEFSFSGCEIRDEWLKCINRFLVIEQGMYRISAPAPAGLASGPFWQIRPSPAPARFFDRIWPDSEQLSCMLITSNSTGTDVDFRYIEAHTVRQNQSAIVFCVAYFLCNYVTWQINSLSIQSRWFWYQSTARMQLPISHQ